MVVRTRIVMMGNIKDYIGAPVTNRFVSASDRDPLKNVGIITNVVEVNGMYELTMHITDDDFIKKISQPGIHSFEIH